MKKIVLAVLLCCVFGVASSNADERQEEKTTAGQAWMDTAEWKEWEYAPEWKDWLTREKDWLPHHSEGLEFWDPRHMQAVLESESWKKWVISEQGKLFLQEYQKKQRGEKEKEEEENNL